VRSVAPFASSIGYNSSGMVGEVRHQGNVVDTYEDDHAMGRPSRIQVTGCPTAPIITPQQSSMCVNTPNSASVIPVSGASYSWSIENGNITSTTQSSITFTSASPGTVILHVTITATGCLAASGQTSIVVTGAPSITSGEPTDPNPIAPGPAATATLVVHASGSSLTYQWYEGVAPDTSHAVTGQTSSSFTTPNLSVTKSYWVQVGSPCGSANSRTATVTVLGAPLNVQATTESTTTRVMITWDAVSNATSYVAQYALRVNAPSGDFTDVGPPTNGLSAEHIVAGSVDPMAYVYRVVSLDGAGRRSPAESPRDYAVTASMLWNEPIEKRVTRIKAAHIVELRKAIDAVRVAANQPPLWQNASPPSGLITPGPITTLFAGFNEARAAFGLPNFTYSGGIPMPQTNGAILSEHIQEVRNALR
jgi:hypothetical protein